MSEQPTPETDAAAWTETNWENACVRAKFARKLERERDEAIIKYTGQANEFEKQRNIALAKLEEAREALRAVLELANDIPDESLDDWKIEFHKVLEEAK